MRRGVHLLPPPPVARSSPLPAQQCKSISTAANKRASSAAFSSTTIDNIGHQLAPIYSHTHRSPADCQSIPFPTEVDQQLPPVRHESRAGTTSSPWGQQSSFAQLVDPDEGTELKFVPSNVINGVRCAHLERTDVEVEIQYWQSAVLCSVLGANPPLR